MKNNNKINLKNLDELPVEFYENSMFSPEVYEKFKACRAEYLNSNEGTNYDDALFHFINSFSNATFNKKNKYNEKELAIFAIEVVDASKLASSIFKQDLFELLNLGGKKVLSDFISLSENYKIANSAAEKFAILSSIQKLIDDARANRNAWSMSTNEMLGFYENI